LAAFAGLGALGHLDLQFPGLTRYWLVTPNRPEATCLIALFLESPLASAVAGRVFAAFAGVALAADAVHGDGRASRAPPWLIEP
jgi:hypothetical protein